MKAAGYYTLQLTDICWTFLYRAFEIILPCRIRFIHFNFDLVEKFEHVQTFQLVNFPVTSVIPALNFGKLVPKLKSC